MVGLSKLLASGNRGTPSSSLSLTLKCFRVTIFSNQFPNYTCQFWNMNWGVIVCLFCRVNVRQPPSIFFIYSTFNLNALCLYLWLVLLLTSYFSCCILFPGVEIETCLCCIENEQCFCPFHSLPCFVSFWSLLTVNHLSVSEASLCIPQCFIWSTVQTTAQFRLWLCLISFLKAMFQRSFIFFIYCSYCSEQKINK